MRKSKAPRDEYPNGGGGEACEDDEREADGDEDDEGTSVISFSYIYTGACVSGERGSTLHKDPGPRQRPDNSAA